jgi:hypothetical protein
MLFEENLFNEDEYPRIIHEVMQHIEHIKKRESDSSLLDIIYDYCFQNNIPVEVVGDAISTDVYFKSFIQKDCELHNIFRTEKNTLDEW